MSHFHTVQIGTSEVEFRYNPDSDTWSIDIYHNDEKRYYLSKTQFDSLYHSPESVDDWIHDLNMSVKIKGKYAQLIINYIGGHHEDYVFELTEETAGELVFLSRRMKKMEIANASLTKTVSLLTEKVSSLEEREIHTVMFSEGVFKIERDGEENTLYNTFVDNVVQFNPNMTVKELQELKDADDLPDSFFTFSLEKFLKLFIMSHLRILLVNAVELDENHMVSKCIISYDKQPFDYAYLYSRDGWGDDDNTMYSLLDSDIIREDDLPSMDIKMRVSVDVYTKTALVNDFEIIYC